jgi:hypothetical protein
MDSATITWLAAIGYVLVLIATFVVYTWIVGSIVRRREVHHPAEVRELPRAPQIRKVA